MTGPMPHSRTLGALVREWSKKSPHSQAIAAEGTNVSFAELDERADEWARGLLAQGVAKGQSVGLLAGNHAEWLIAAVGTVRIGAVLVPLNTWYQSDELAYTISHGDVSVVIYSPEMRGTNYAARLAESLDNLDSEEYRSRKKLNVPEWRRPQMVEMTHGQPANSEALTADALLRSGESVARAVLDDREMAVTGDDLAYIIYTSGSTARPKGVQIEHGHMIVNTFNIGERQGVGSGDRSFVASPLFYGLGLLQAIGATWTHGACAVLMEIYEPGRALEILEKERCTVFYGLGNMTRSLASHPDRGTRELVVSKGVLGLAPADKVVARNELGMTRGTAIYGLTESYGLCAVSDWMDPFDLAKESIGRPLPGWEIVIADPVTDEALPAGQIGQILIRGHVTRGYHKDEQKTRETFTADGFFRTGDLAHADDDGNLYFDSRLSELMKPAGINVSPLEVEYIIGDVDGLGEVHVVGVPDDANGDLVIAFVDRAGSDVTEEQIKEHVRSAAAKYKTPHRVFFREPDELPRVASGKVPKVRLRELAQQLLKDG